jgi:PAS domain S-box-containing protein
LESEPDKENGPRTGVRILLADDNADMRAYVRRLLVARGHEVIAVEHGEAALAAIRAETPALVLSDVMMPRLDGFDLLRTLRGDTKTRAIPIILISARAGEEARAEGVEAGADDYLTKPFTARELLARVSTHLELARVRREAEEKIRLTMESITDGLHVVDAKGRFTYLNASARRMMSENGLDPDELIGRDYFEAFPATREMRVGQTMRLSLTERVTTETENFYAPWQRWFSVRHYPTADGGVSTFFLDITERKRAEAVTLATERRFRQLADTLPQMVWITKPDGAHEYFNKRWYEFTGMPEGSLGGEGWAKLFHPDDDQRVRAHWKKNRETGDLYEIEYRLKSRAGDYCWFLCRALPVRDEAGHIINWFGTCTDIDNFKRVEQALRETKAAAESANRSKDQFLAALSHELRTPLTPVLMMAATLKEDERLPAEVREQLGMMERNIALEGRLIDDLLDISAIANGKLHLHRQFCDTHSLILLAVEIVRDAALTKEIKVACELNAALSGLMTDPARFQQVIWNLLRNAVKFTPRGGRVFIRTSNPDANRLRIEIIDSGIGIAPAALEKIFLPFEQAAVAGDHRFGGLGLGLAIAQAIVGLHDGNISAHSGGANLGATFIVEFPAATSPPSGIANSKPPPAAVGAAVRPLRLLLVEDHLPSLQVLANLLIRDGHHVVAVGTITEAMAAAKAQTFNLVISDLGLPDGTGNQLMEKLRLDHGLKGIALSGYGMDEDITRSRDAGFVTHLVKPVHMAELQRALGQLFN